MAVSLASWEARLPSRGSRISIGPHPDCASPMNPTPAALAELRRISVQPKDVDTCVQWWAVDIYVSLAGRITVVALDLWAP